MDYTALMILSLVTMVQRLSFSQEDVPPLFAREECNNFTANYHNLRNTFESHNYHLYLQVDTQNGVDDASCLNGSVPCRNLSFAVYGRQTMFRDSDVLQAELHDVDILLHPGVHHLTSVTRLSNSSYVYIHGYNASNTTVRCTRFPNAEVPCVYDNLAAVNSSFIRLKDLTITQCGPISVGVWMDLNENVIVEDCIFEGNSASGLLARSSNKVYLVNNLFQNAISYSYYQYDNFSQFSETCTGLDYDSIFSISIDTGGGLSITADENTHEVLIWRAQVLNNTAPPPFNILSVPDTFRPFGRGAGLTIISLGSRGSHICIKDSEISRNTAELGGGGISYTLSKDASGNTLTVDNSVIEGNTCTKRNCTGGGIHVTEEGTGQSSAGNTVYMYDTSVVDNRAEGGTGGGLMLEIFRNRSRHYFINCTFRGNFAGRDGSAVVILAFTGVTELGSSLFCWDCIFENNIGEGHSNSGLAALYAYSTSVYLYGQRRGTRFVNNTGGGVEAILGLVAIRGEAEFRDNTAVLGGAMRITTRSRLYVAENATVRFIGNNATDVGGALYVRDTFNPASVLQKNSECFIQPNLPHTPFTLDLPPGNWSLSLMFQSNRARNGGSAIYIENIESCCWTGTSTFFGEDNCTTPIFMPPGNTSLWPFSYWYANGTVIKDTEDITDRLATSATTLTTTLTGGTTDVAFREAVPLQVTSFDYFSHTRKTVVQINTHLTNPVILKSGANGSASYYFQASDEVLPELIRLCRGTPLALCTESVPVNLDIKIPEEVGSAVEASRPLSIKLCHPGYLFSNHTRRCECRKELDYLLRITCDNLGRYFSVQGGLWVRMYANNTELEGYQVPQVFLDCSKDTASIPSCQVQFDNLDGQCAKGRKGVACGTCDAERQFGITMDLSYCFDNCSPYLGVALFLATCVAVIVSCVLLLYFNVGVPNELRGFFLFVQVIGIVYSYRTFFVSESDGIDPFNILINLFAVNLPFPVCIHQDLTALWMAALGYVPPFLALATVGTFAICAKYVSKFASRSTLSGITFILLFVYVLLATPSFYLFNCAPSSDGTEFLHRFTGQPCLALPHVIWLVISGLVILGFVIPAPFFLMVISCRHFSRAKHFSDAFSSGLKRRWYSSWDLIRRLGFILIGSYFPLYISHRILGLLLFEVIVFVVHGLAHPYERKWINFAEGAILADLFFATVAILQPGDRYLSKRLTSVFVVAPYIYAVPVVLYLMGKYVWKNIVSQKWRERLEVYFSRDSFSSSFKYHPLKNNQHETVDVDLNDRKMSIFYVNMDGEANPHNYSLQSSSDFSSVPLVSASCDDELHYRQELMIQSSDSA